MPRIFKMQPNRPEILLTIFKGMPPRVDVLVEGAVKFSYICALLDFFQSTCFQGINILRLNISGKSRLIINILQVNISCKSRLIINILRLNISCKSRLMMRIGGQEFFHPIVDTQ